MRKSKGRHHAQGQTTIHTREEQQKNSPFKSKEWRGRADEKPAISCTIVRRVYSANLEVVWSSSVKILKAV
jgi:hypothetical protein